MKYESDVEGTVAARALNELGVFSIKIKKAQERGYPDRLFLIPNGVPLFIEFKRVGEDPKPYQLLIHKRLRHANYKIEVHEEIEPAMQAIRKAMDAGQDTTHRRGVARKPRVSSALLRPRSR